MNTSYSNQLETESGMFEIRRCETNEVQHTSPDLINEIPVIATAQSGEWIYMLLQRSQVEQLLQ